MSTLSESAVGFGRAIPPSPKRQSGRERPLLLEDILDLRRAHWLKDCVNPDAQPFGANSCLLIPSDGVQQFHVSHSDGWADYDRIRESFSHEREAKKSSGSPVKRSPFPHEWVFSPVKIVIADTDEPIRASMTSDAVYPKRAKVGLLRANQPLAMAFAATALLNSTVGQAYYRRLLHHHEGKARSQFGLLKSILKKMPVAAADYQDELLFRLAKETYQLSTLYRASREISILDLLPFIQTLHGRVSSDSYALLGLSEVEVIELLLSVQDLDLKDELGVLTLFSGDWMNTPVVPVRLLSAPDRERFRFLKQQAPRELTPGDTNRLEQWNRLEYWEYLANADLPWSLRPTSPLMENRYTIHKETISYIDPTEPVGQADWPAPYYDIPRSLSAAPFL
ncbi:MAG: hypothetical protein M3Y56_09155 [Armatimonadota bacterium]|nr:hypothetical protein [Armatimonadota bacterium]